LTVRFIPGAVWTCKCDTLLGERALQMMGCLMALRRRATMVDATHRAIAHRKTGVFISHLAVKNASLRGAMTD
jgi:hypothetical protein